VRYFIDCEFDGHNGALLSMAIVPETGASLHISTRERATDLWVIENVIPVMGQHQGSIDCVCETNYVGPLLKKFLSGDDDITIISDSPVDIYRFCRALSTGEDYEWASSNFSTLKFEVHNVDCYPTTLKYAVQHNAWWDAMALREKLT
jgi:hypothetical protein